MRILLVLDQPSFGDALFSIAKACAPYCDIMRYRAKGLSIAQTYDNAARLRDMLPDNELWLSEYADMATILGYEGVSVGINSMPVAAIKATFPQLTVCYAAHTVEECSLPADCFTLSPLFPTEKPYEVIPLGAIPAPAANVYALGGISFDKVPLLEELGYAGVAGISFYKEIKPYR
jgi:thiamine-phosphate pyrophosphorylase